MQNTKTNIDITTIHKEEFEVVYYIISSHRNKVVQVINNESLSMMWEIGGFVSTKIKSANWGDGIVRQLAEYIHTQDPTARGWSYRTLYKMVQFYETYSSESFGRLLSKADTSSMIDIVPFKTAQNTAQEEKRHNENPSIGILLCKEADMEVVRFALNRSMSPTMVTQYKEQLQVGGVIQRSLVEFCRFLNNGTK